MTENTAVNFTMNVTFPFYLEKVLRTQVVGLDPHKPVETINMEMYNINDV